jgi:photosystem II stability/assembly factor-like uncharacterized protein
MKKLFTVLIVCAFTVITFGQVFDWQWQNPKPHGNTMRAVKILGPNTIVALGAAGTVQKTTNNGITWEVSYVDLQGREFRGIDFVSASIGYACGSIGLLAKTTDGGSTFTILDGSTTELLYDIDFIDADTGFVSGANGTLLKTTDGGTTWNPVTTPVTNAIYAVCAQAPDNLFIGTVSTGATQRLSRSTDYGATWVEITPAGLAQTIWDINFINTTIGWVATQNGGRVYYTTDAGATWGNTVVNGLIVPNTVKFKDALTGFVVNNNNGDVYKTTDGGLTWAASGTAGEPLYAVDVSNSTVYAVGRSGSTWKSTDEGNNYFAAFDAVTVGQVRYIRFVNSTTGYASTGSTTTTDSLGYLLKTTNAGMTWTDVGYNFKHLVYSFALASSNVWYIGRGRNAIFKTTDGGATFVEQAQPITSATAHFYDIGFVDENNGYASTSTGGIIKTTDGGTTWENANSPFGTTAVYAINVFSANKVLAVGGSAKAFMTTDGGATWEAVTTNIPGNFFTTRFLNDNYGIIAGFNSPNPVAAKTTDGGTTWTPLNFPVEFDGNSLWAIGYRDENYIWLGGINGSIYFTTDGGTSWTSSKPVSGNAMYSISIVNNDMWISGGNGTILKGYSDPNIPVELVSFNASVNGKDINLVWKTATELNNSGFEVERRYANAGWEKIGFVAGKGTTTEISHYSYTDTPAKTGVIQYRLKQVDYDGTFEYSQIVEVDLTAPVKFALSQNYPNPFNPATSIKYSLAAKSKVELKVYNILGKEVALLVNETQDAGNYEVQFNAEKLSSGIYIYELNAGAFSAKKKMMLVK